MTDPHRVTSHDAALELVVEKLRLMGYSGFWVVVLTGILLTKAFGDVDLQEQLPVKVFGYNNICVYFDHPPSTYVLPFLWGLVDLMFLIFAAVVPMAKAAYLLFFKPGKLDVVHLTPRIASQRG